jgi:hypothetical protein
VAANVLPSPATSGSVTGHRFSQGHTSRSVVSLGCETLSVSQISASLRFRWLTAPSMVDEIMQAQLLTAGETYPTQEVLSASRSCQLPQSRSERPSMP